MTEEKLSKVFGDEFKQKYKDTVERIRNSKIRVTDEQRAEIIQQAKSTMTPDNPSFIYNGMKVLLAEVPANLRRRELDFGVSVPMLHMGEWISCLFGEDTKELSVEIQEGEHYILVGNYREKSGENGTFKNLRVRALIKLDELSETPSQESSPDNEHKKINDWFGEL